MHVLDWHLLIFRSYAQKLCWQLGPVYFRQPGTRPNAYTSDVQATRTSEATAVYSGQPGRRDALVQVMAVVSIRLENMVVQ